jgi:hypothetical protein
MVRGAHGLLVVLHDQDRVPHVPQVGQGVEQAPVVARVQPDGGFVQHVEHPPELRPDLGRQPDALPLPPGERGRRAVERKIPYPDIDQEFQPVADLPEDLPGDPLLPRREGDGGEGVPGGRQRHPGVVGDGEAVDPDGATLGPQPRPPAGGAVLGPEQAVEFLPGAGVPGLPEQTPEPGTDSPLPLPTGEIGGAHRFRQLPERGRRVDPAPARQCEQGGLQVVGDPGVIDRKLHFGDAEARVGNEALRVEDRQLPHAVAVGAGAVARIEGEGAGLQGRHADAAFQARLALGKEALLDSERLDGHQPLGKFERLPNRRLQPAVDPGLDDDPVDHHLDRVVAGLGQGDRLFEFVHPAVHAHPQVPLLEEGFKQLPEFPLPVAHHRGHHHHPRPLRVFQDLLHDPVRRLRRDRLAAPGAVGAADGGEQQAGVVVDLGDGSYGGSGAAAGGLLLDADRGGEPLGAVQLRLFHPLQELPRVGRKRFDVAPLPLRVDGVESQAGFARPGQAGDDRQLVPRDFEADVTEVMLARSANDYLF